ncbi:MULTISPECIES: addiction module antidote protein [Acinetobacter]|uniref:Addiction module antidote protein n=2 Tax=Acinetobacter TaxID=469 RepID=A0ABT3NNJ4_9GAMM|nr:MULTISPECIES: addiction module antidote protein [Acinetobacter]MCW8041133.1 putative addiction module antidote protein [Acinetobacter entericus]RZG64083.1 putative addiction module antidote protein [Acinetobacter bouvetii]TCB76781.1 putative addiction module antidote protein [Acinetobacter sp. ANC 4177]
MTVKLKKWNIQDHLKTEEDRQAYLEAALEEAGDDPAYIAHVLGDIAKSYGMTKLAQETGLTREGLYKSFGKQGNPSFVTVSKVASAMGLKLTFQHA